MRKALFMDRDGTINVDRGYVHRIEDFEFLPGAVEFMKAARDKEYLLIVVTNQSGIARGMYSEDDYRRLTDHMRRLLAGQGVELAGVYHCPSLDDQDPDRKPNPGMFLRAARDFGLDLAASASVGDGARDAEAARRAGVGRDWLLTEDGFEMIAAEL